MTTGGGEGSGRRDRPLDGDPEALLAALAPRLRALDDVPAPNPAFVRRLEEKLMLGHATTLPGAGRYPAPNGAGGPGGDAARRPGGDIRRASPRPWRGTVETLAAAALVVAVMAGAVGAGLLAALRGNPAPGPAPAVAFATPPASGGTPCVLEPRADPIAMSAEAGTPVGLPGTPTAALALPTDLPPAPSGNPFGIPEELLPTGAAADAAAVAGITDALVQWTVCGHERGLAAFSDDYFRRPELRGEDDGNPPVLSPVPLRGVERAEDVPLRDARVLPDGRVGVVVEQRFMGPSFKGNFFVFVERGDRWLIDEFVVVRADDPAASPSASTATCETTLPNGNTPPGERASAAHHGNGRIWTALWLEGRVVFEPGGPGSVEPDGSLAMKWIWWWDAPGELGIQGRRLDAPAPPLRSEAGGGRRLDLPATPSGAVTASDSTRQGFQATTLVFPTAGCWEVTGWVGDARLTFVTRVTIEGPGPQD